MPRHIAVLKQAFSDEKKRLFSQKSETTTADVVHHIKQENDKHYITTSNFNFKIPTKIKIQIIKYLKSRIKNNRREKNINLEDSETEKTKTISDTPKISHASLEIKTTKLHKPQ